jgi:UDP-N-acetylmuramate dehydrogenase
MPLNIDKNIKLTDHTTWRVGGVAEYFCQPLGIHDLRLAFKFVEDHDLPMTVIGGGSNILISDQGIKGLVVCLDKFVKVEFKVDASDPAHDRVVITALAGTGKSELLKIFLKHKLAPALFLAGLPGNVGGGVVMNAGIGEKIEPREFCEIVDWIEVLRDSRDEPVRLQRDDLNWSYRHCEGWRPGIITKVQLSWKNQAIPEMLDLVRQANKNRLMKQPLDMPSCGSVFINPDGHSSGQLIEECGLKGFQIGDAQVSQKHANFIVNLGNATAMDIDQVIKHVQKTVLEKKQISLKTEVVYLGW